MESALEIRQLKAFIALVEQGNITAAAQVLGLAQSTMSETLTSLERAVGAVLFLRRRGAHGVALTGAGEALLPHARSMLGMVEAAHVAVAGATTGARARIAIATNESLSTYVLLSPLDALRRSWPNTTFEVTVMMCNEVRSGIDAGIYDMGLLLQPLDDATSSLVADRIVVSDDVPLVIFTQPSHPLAVGARSGARPGPILRDALADFPLYLSDAAGDFHSLVRRFLEDDGLPGPRLHATGSVEGVKRGVLADARALGMLPAYALVEEIEAGQVVPLRVHPAPPHMLLEALVSKTRAQHPAARRLLDELLATYQLRPDCAPSSPPRSNERRIHQTGD